MKRQIAADEALTRLETLCSRSEQCSADIRRKLLKWGISAADTSQILKSLTDNSYIDDRRFARAFVRDKYRFSSWGVNKIRLGLRAKGIAGDLIDTALEEIDRKQYQILAFKAMKSKLRTLDRDDLNACRTKLLRFGLSRGYEYPLLARILKSQSLWISAD